MHDRAFPEIPDRSCVWVRQSFHAFQSLMARGLRGPSMHNIVKVAILAMLLARLVAQHNHI